MNVLNHAQLMVDPDEIGVHHEMKQEDKELKNDA